MGEKLLTNWMSDPLPQYERPPVVETAFAVEFAPLKGWNIVHYGLLWERFKDRYPKFEVHPYFPIVSARLDPQDPLLRCFYLNGEGTQIVQVRPGAFARNWRAMPQDNEYPRYATIRPSFEQDFEVFEGFLRELGFPPLEAWRCEVTYINHFPQGPLWNDFSALPEILPILSTERLEGLVNKVDHTSFVFGYQLPEGAGSLRIELQPVVSPQGKQILQLTLTAVGQPEGSDLASILSWLDKGRYAIVKSFSQFTSREIQDKVWGRKCRS